MRCGAGCASLSLSLSPLVADAIVRARRVVVVVFIAIADIVVIVVAIVVAIASRSSTLARIASIGVTSWLLSFPRHFARVGWVARTVCAKRPTGMDRKTRFRNRYPSILARGRSWVMTLQLLRGKVLPRTPA